MKCSDCPEHSMITNKLDERKDDIIELKEAIKTHNKLLIGLILATSGNGALIGVSNFVL